MIAQHVLQFSTSARIALLARLLRNEYQIRQLMQQYPVELVGPDYRAVMSLHSSQGFTIEGWVDALWASL